MRRALRITAKAVWLFLVAVWNLVKLAIFTATVTVIAPAAAFGTALAAFVFLPLPGSVPVAAAPDLSQPTLIYDTYGNQIGEIRGFESRIPMAAEDVPEVLKKAVIAAEDRRFYEHDGVDPQGIARALWVDVREGRSAQGGSTITQQYVKQVFLDSDRTLTRKVREAILAARVDRQLDKDDILFRYLQVTYFGDGAYGAAAAAESFFRKPLADLDLSEAATLAGIIPSPSRYNPRDDLATAEQRRQLVLRLMREHETISAAEFTDAIDRTLWTPVDFTPPPPGATVVWPRPTFDTPHPYFVDYVNRWLLERYGEDKVLTGGLRVYTTLDPFMQAMAREETERVLGTAPEGLEMSLVTVEPQTGFVRALIGGRDYNAPGGQVNLALGRAGGGSGRQPGSAFKPFVLAEAFERRIPPSRTMSGLPHEIDTTTFDNYGGAVYGDLTLEEATVRSANTPFTRLTEEMGVEAVINRARAMGADPVPYDPARDGLAVALGSSEVSPLGMASGYATFATGGRHIPPLPVSVVTDADGNVIDDFTSTQGEQVLEPNTAANINSILAQVLERGTAEGKGLFRPAAGKTGTTTANRDAWFVGYTPALSTAVWVGYRDAPAPLVGINGVRSVTGGTIPAATWQRFMLRAHETIEPTGFDEPAPILPRVERTQAEEITKEPEGFRYTGRRMTITTTPTPTYIEPGLPAPAAPAPRQTPWVDPPDPGTEPPTGAPADDPEVPVSPDPSDDPPPTTTTVPEQEPPLP